MDEITLPTRTFRLGEKKYIGVKNVRAFDGSTISVTGTVIVYDSTGSTALTVQTLTMTGSGTRKMGGKYLLTTGAALNLTTSGTYRAVYTLTNGSEIQSWQQEIVVKTNPT